MFTGIIEEVGTVFRRTGSDLTITARRVLEDLKDGDSVAIDGACMTVVEHTERTFAVQVSPESLRKTTLGRLTSGDAVNLERPLAAGERFGGHFVLGHVDGVGSVESVERQEAFALWRFHAPAEVFQYLVPKGSIAIDGISLTVVEPAGDTFAVAVIPATLEKTTLHARRPGDPVNMEADIVAKHIHHLLTEPGGVTKDLLARHGFA